MSSITNTHSTSNRDQRILKSKHAKRRCQQRGIKDSWIPLVKAFGQRDFDGHGALRYSMTADAMDRMFLSCGQSTKLQALQGVYIVVAVLDQTVITVAHLHH
jgi:hypothetical protein